MSKSRREFLTEISIPILAGTAAFQVPEQKQKATEPPAGAPPAFGTAPPVGPAVSPETFTEAEKLVRVEMTASDRAEAASNWRESMAALYERRTGPRQISLEAQLSPATQWNPVLPGMKAGPHRDRFLRSKNDPGQLPSKDDDIAFAPVTQLSRWIESRNLSSERLTNIYLDRLERFDPKLRCVITLTRELALAQAKRADEEIAAGKYRGPLHGIPWGAKDLLDTAGIPTTYGAEPYRNRVPCERRRCGEAPARCGRGAGRQAEHGRAGIE